ncbi:probable SAM dependent methyltransferase [Treponema paraluiscuniculi Cuniculi A]|uniref:SAM dependent methyltransferase n=2 Tax=Treponema paraluiscuniculi TaxID=53435 RepID=A0ABY9E1P7_9SPIR|nr:16S rRNA (guanine(966)-N(2))-methyltransferase RsmD [Treponema paraluiscuniculi]AEH40019.1 probable SAM dependent methyltransferase [Treponema paraluiscuniculi Cuniculi A]WKC71952.1 putative SAM dependent methyltransferase [Treponema paraluiscuniculi]
MRITGGMLKNHVLRCPDGPIRPAMDRMRESLFAVLGDMHGCSFLDLFAGSGVCGLEAYSRGAYPVVFVERNVRSFSVLLQNVQVALCRLECRCMAVERYIARARTLFHFVYLDPPFPYRFHAELLQRLSRASLCREGSVVMVHRPREKKLADKIDSLVRTDQRVYGRSVVDFYRRDKAGLA